MTWCGDPDRLLARDPELGRLALEGQSPARLVRPPGTGHRADATTTATAIDRYVEDAARCTSSC